MRQQRRLAEFVAGSAAVRDCTADCPTENLNWLHVLVCLSKKNHVHALIDVLLIDVLLTPVLSIEQNLYFEEMRPRAAGSYKQ